MPTDYITIPLSKTGKHAGKYEAIVSAEDSDLAELNWSILRDKQTCYAARRDKNKISLMHRVILSSKLERELLPTEQVDHINNNKLDNRRGNLRVASRQQNGFNTPIGKSNSSGYKGASWNKGANKWIATIRVDGNKIHLGLFNTKEEAHQAYCEAATKYFGEFANYGERK